MAAGRQVRNQHVDCGGKTPNGFLAFGDFQVDPHALLATVELHQDGVQSTGVRAGSTCAHIEASDRISCLWMFDLDDLGPYVGQHCAGRWSCNPMRKIQDFHVFQHFRHELPLKISQDANTACPFAQATKIWPTWEIQVNVSKLTVVSWRLAYSLGLISTPDRSS